MALVICLHCGDVNDESDLDYRQWSRDEPMEACCPRCGSEEVVDAYQCEMCEDYFSETDLVEGYDECEECHETN